MDYLAFITAIHKFATNVLMLPDYWHFLIITIAGLVWWITKLRKASDKRDDTIMKALHAHDEKNEKDFATQNARMDEIDNDVKAVAEEVIEVKGMVSVILKWIQADKEGVK